MSNAVTVMESKGVQESPAFSKDQVELLKRTICKDSSDDEFMLFCHVAKRSGLDPFARQIHAVKRWNDKSGRFDMTIQVGIDGFRLIADRTGAYAGSDDPVFDNEKQPTKATVTVYKMVGGQRCPFTATARWGEYFPGEKQGFMWRKMPCLMLSKVAESLALRKAFPAELSGLYTNEEMEQAAVQPPVVAPDKHRAGNGVVTQDPNTLLTGQWARYSISQISAPELRKRKEMLEAKPQISLDEERDLNKISEYLCSLEQMDPVGAEPMGGAKEFVKCECGSELILSERKGVYYCKNFKDSTQPHSRTIAKAEYEKGLDNEPGSQG